ncbi:MAG: hypothetical protein LBI66_06850 [Burkholderiaceae bacterium]|jgi:hypothetical protein|nr:hypothetical protein [Burkholderiaceae bacterium]
MDDMLIIFVHHGGMTKKPSPYYKIVRQPNGLYRVVFLIKDENTCEVFGLGISLVGYRRYIEQRAERVIELECLRRPMSDK